MSDKMKAKPYIPATGIHTDLSPERRNELPFEGLLMIVNLGEENFDDLNLSSDYIDSVSNAIRLAHAGGHAVLYLYDLANAHLSKPTLFGELEGSDFSSLITTICPEIKKFSFKKEYDEQLFKIASNIFNNGIEPNVNFDQKYFETGNIKITGIFTIAGQEQMLPVTEIIVKKPEIELERPRKTETKKTIKKASKTKAVNKIKRV